MNAMGILFEWGVVFTGIELPSLPATAATAILAMLAGACGALLGVVDGASGRPTVTADRMTDAEGRARVFRLTLGLETITLDPGKPWVKADAYKWVTRGLMEAPQSYHVLPNGTVEINGEKIALDEPTATQRLEHELNKRHTSGIEARKPPAAMPPAPTPAGTTAPPNRVRFGVKLDHLGHLVVDCAGGSERMEVGLRGLTTLMQNGLMLRPASLHVDPLQRSIEIDGHRFECSEAGARGLQELLNEHYAPALKDAGSHLIEITQNPASATGFDIRFVTLHAGVRVQIKGHLAQDKLDVLQDSGRCDLLQHGILLKLSPPNLLIRRRRPDGGEEHIPELPDVAYRRVTAAQLQQLLNHPLIRRDSGSGEASTVASAPERTRELGEVWVTRSPQYPAGLWLECVEAHSGKAKGMAFTHHNLVELQQSGAFNPKLKVALSMDHRVLSILNPQTGQEDKVTVDATSSAADLVRAGQLLRAALKPRGAPLPESAPAPPPPCVGPLPAPEPSSAPVLPPSGGDLALTPPPLADLPPQPAPPVSQPHPEIAEAFAAAKPPAPEEPANANEDKGRPPEPLAEMAFSEADPARLNTAVFWSLVQPLDLSVQEVWLSLLHVFENRRFEVLNFNRAPIEDITELRSAGFYGFYLTHVDEQNVILVYACRGRHIEWGTRKCVLQPSLTAEAEEFPESALRGLAQDLEGNFVFVVSARYRAWVGSRAREYLPVCVRFATVEELLEHRNDYSFIWPQRVAASG